MTAAPGGGRIASLHPAYFAMVMATGIVSIAAQLLGMTAVAWLLFALNLVFYPALVALTIVRIARYRDRVVADLLDHGRSVGFFTTVAGDLRPRQPVRRRRPGCGRPRQFCGQSGSCCGP